MIPFLMNVNYGSQNPNVFIKMSEKVNFLNSRVIENIFLARDYLAIKDGSPVDLSVVEQNGKLHPLQKAFVEHDALQCGYCTPGMIMNAYGLLLNNPRPTRNQIIEQMDGNLCRCGAHMRIVTAIEEAARQMGGRA